MEERERNKTEVRGRQALSENLSCPPEMWVDNWGLALENKYDRKVHSIAQGIITHTFHHCKLLDVSAG